MSIEVFLELIESKYNSKQITNAFNSLSVEDRIDILEVLSIEKKESIG